MIDNDTQNALAISFFVGGGIIATLVTCSLFLVKTGNLWYLFGIIIPSLFMLILIISVFSFYICDYIQSKKSDDNNERD